jgi:Cysteine-rich secretory protein family
MAASDLENLLLQLVNASRAEVGLAPLVFDAELVAAARDHSVWMDQTDTFSHTGVGNSSPGDRIAAGGYDATGWAENIVYTSASWRSDPLDQATVDQLHRMLRDSPPPREHPLHRRDGDRDRAPPGRPQRLLHGVRDRGARPSDRRRGGRDRQRIPALRLSCPLEEPAHWKAGATAGVPRSRLRPTRCGAESSVGVVGEEEQGIAARMS